MGALASTLTTIFSGPLVPMWFLGPDVQEPYGFSQGPWDDQRSDLELSAQRRSPGGRFGTRYNNSISWQKANW